MNRILKSLSALTLALILCLGAAAATFAEEAPEYITQAAIAKQFEMPHGTLVPDVTFEFQVSPVGVDGDKSQTAQDAMPKIGENGTEIVKIEFPQTKYTYTEQDGDTDIYYMESDELFGNVNWTHGGEYVYHIKEINKTYVSTLTPKPQSETLNYSNAEYELTVLVGEDGKGGYEVIAIGAMRVVKEDGTTGDVKVDPTPGSVSIDNEYSQMTFRNTYVKTNGGTDPKDDKDWTLSISKKVSGDFSDSGIYFDFLVKVSAPSLVSGTPTYNAYVVEKAETGYKVVTSNENGAISGSDAHGSFIAFESDEAQTIHLKHGQTLVFVNTPVGSHYSVSESGTAAYVPSVTVIYDSENGIKYEHNTINMGQGLTIPSEGTIQGPLYVGEGKNSADFDNQRDMVTPTGLNLNDLPFIAMIGIAVLSIAGYLLAKSRRARYDR